MAGRSIFVVDISVYFVYTTICMNTAVINIRTDAQVKKQAQKVAGELGMSLSGLINGLLKHVIKTKTVTFTAREEPSPWLIKALKESREDIKKGFVSPAFDNVEDAIKWLNDPKATYQNGHKV